jgi:hypothetical protein
VIGAVPAGAIRYHSNRLVLDLSGAHTFDALNTAPLEYGLEQEVDYLVAFREPFFDSIPDRVVAHESSASINTSLASNIMRAYGPPGSVDDFIASPHRMFQFDPVGLELIDALDVGNPTALLDVSESAHDYGVEGERFTNSQTMRVSNNETLLDDAMVFHEAEEFTVGSVPGEPLTIVKRYDASVGGNLAVFADGMQAGEWELPVERVFFGEAAFTIPAELVTAFRTRLRFELIPGSSAIAGNSFYYWILVPEGSAPRG